MDTVVEAPDPGKVVSWASLMILRVLPDRAKYQPAEKEDLTLGFIFVINPKEFGKNSKYKIVGGSRKNEDRKPVDTAIREVFEEAGISVDPKRVKYLDRRFGGRGVSHWKYLFIGDVFQSDRGRMHSNHPANEGEVPTFFTDEGLREEIYKGRFLETHVEWMKQLGVIPKSDIAA